MLICTFENCTCFYHRLLECIEEKINDEAKSILQNVDSIGDLADNSGSTLMHYSAKYGNAALLQYFIDKKCKVNAQNINGLTPLMMSIENKHVIAVENLLKNNADVFLTEHNGMSSFQLAIENRLYSSELRENCERIMNMLMDKINLHFLRDKEKMTQLLLNTNDFVKLGLVVFGNRHLVDFMMENGYVIEYREPRTKRSALDLCIYHANFENTKMLIDRGANINANFDSEYYMPLQHYRIKGEAIDEGSAFLKYLLTHALGNVSLSDRTRRKDVEHLLFFGKKKTVQTVLEFGIDMRERFEICKDSLLTLLIRNKNVDFIEVFDELSIRIDADEFASDRIGALFQAAFLGSLRKVEFLLESKVFHGAVSSEALFAAVTNAYSKTREIEKDVGKITELLLLCGADAQFVFFNGKGVLDEMFYTQYQPSTNVVLAHLAMLEAINVSSLTDLTRSKIKNCPVFKNRFNLCTQQLKVMKELEIFGTVTLFKLLTKSDAKIIVYARNRELVLAFKNAMNNVNLEEYYSNILHKRMENATNRVMLEQKAAVIFESLTDFCKVGHYHIVSKLFRYLNLEDLQNLCKF